MHGPGLSRLGEGPQLGGHTDPPVNGGQGGSCRLRQRQHQPVQRRRLCRAAADERSKHTTAAKFKIRHGAPACTCIILGRSCSDGERPLLTQPTAGPHASSLLQVDAATNSPAVNAIFSTDVFRVMEELFGCLDGSVGTFVLFHFHDHRCCVTLLCPTLSCCSPSYAARPPVAVVCNDTSVGQRHGVGEIRSPSVAVRSACRPRLSVLHDAGGRCSAVE